MNMYQVIIKNYKENRFPKSMFRVIFKSFRAIKCTKVHTSKMDILIGIIIAPLILVFTATIPLAGSFSICPVRDGSSGLRHMLLSEKHSAQRPQTHG
jgi:hypothetical protein